MTIKAYSTGLEIEVYGKKEEFVFPINTILKFKDAFGSKGSVPFILKYDQNQKEEIKYLSIPKNSYLDCAKNITIIINEEYKEDLFERGWNVQRFMSSGKLRTAFKEK